MISFEFAQVYPESND